MSALSTTLTFKSSGDHHIIDIGIQFVIVIPPTSVMPILVEYNSQAEKC